MDSDVVQHGGSFEHANSAPSPTHDTWGTFQTYLSGFFVSMIGDAFTLVALPIAAFSLNKSSVLVGFVDMMEMLSTVLLGTLLGIFADRNDSRLVLWVSDFARAALLVILGVLAWQESLSPASLLLIAFGLGTLRAFHDGAESALLHTIIPVDREMQAFARLSGAESVGRLIGPLLGGLALEGGLWAAFGIDAATFGAAGLAVLLIPVTRRTSSTQERSISARPTIRQDFASALAAMRRRPTYLALVGVGSFGNLAGLTLAGLFVPFATEVLHVKEVGFAFGALLALMGVGGLVANWFVNRQTRHDPRSAGLAMALVGASVVVAGALPSIFTSVLAMLLAGGGMSYYQANYSAYRQRTFPVEMLGRVAMVTRTIFFLTMITGLSTGGVISDRLGPAWLLITFGAISLFGVIVVGLIPLEVDPVTGETV